MSTRRRIFFGIIATIVAGVWYLLYSIIADLEPRYRAAVEESMIDSANIVAALVSGELHDGELDTKALNAAAARISAAEPFAKIYEVTKSKVDMRLMVTDATGLVRFDSSGRLQGSSIAEYNDFIRTMRGEYGARTTRDQKDDPNTTVLYVSAPIKAADTIKGIVTLGEPTAGLNQFLTLAKRKIYSATALAAVSVLVAGLAAAFILTRPIGMLLDYLKLLRETRPSTLPRFGRSAAGIIGRTVDEMREALQSRGYVERYVQTLTHELKSPLSAVRGAAELINDQMPSADRQRFLDNILSETNRMQTVIDRLLELATLERRRGLDRSQTVSIAGLFQQVVSATSLQAKQAGVTVECTSDSGLSVSGDEVLLRQALINLVSNAIEFSTSGGKIELSAESGANGVTIQCRDHGAGIPEYARERIFDRFYSLQRPGSGKKSTGLGLSFVREIAELHRGKISVENAPSAGVVARLVLPT